ncbi:MAG: hypothetical protein ACUVT2_07695 [Thiobacillaceae bacterium]
MSVECYAQRLLNPFRGAVHVIHYASAEAVTMDGVHWDIYVSNDALLRDLPQDCRVQTSDIRYGSWSAAQGLKRGPINLYDDFLVMEEMGARVYEHLTRVHERVPFPYADHFELWLLDKAGRPLALLASACSEREATLDASPPVWHAGHAARERFSSAVFPALSRGGDGRQSAADYLTAYVNACAGPEPVVQWFRREADGTGCGLGSSNLALAAAGRTLAAADFPPFFLADSGHDAEHGRLIRDYHVWLAPWLLQLQCLAADQRAELERQARLQALEVARQYRLYPEVVEQREINAALVEAVLLSSRGQDRPAQEDAGMSTFYIELNPGGGEYL